MTKRTHVRELDATGTPDGTTALHGDGTWKVPTDPEVVRDTIATALVAGSNVTITVDDAANTITIAAASGGGAATFTGCKAVRSTVQSIAHNVDTAVSFTDADEYDTNAIHDTATNPTRLTIPATMTGVWEVQVQIAWAGHASATARLGYLKKNGTTVPLYNAGDRRTSTAGDSSYVSFGAHLSLTAGDYLELFVGQSSTVGLNVQATMSIVRRS